MSQDRIEVESKVTFLERTVEALSTTIHEQAQQLDAIELRLKKLEKKLDGDDGPEIGPHDSPPPHY